MKDKKDKGFTLIELISVLVILAIIAIIVTPLVLNLVRKTKDSANRRSVDAYGKSVELAVASYLLNTGDFPSSINDLKVDYKGLEVICKVVNINDDGSVYLSECTVGNDKVKDTSTEDGFYHYGKTKFYQEYKIGDEVTYNGMDFYVIKNSGTTSDSLTLLKAEPLTVDEVNKYGIDENGMNHVNRYTYSSAGTAYDNNGYGGMAYYTSETCGYVNGIYVSENCVPISYDDSDIKYVVDSWANDNITNGYFKTDSLGYNARLMTYDIFINDYGYESINNDFYRASDDSYKDWLYTGNYTYYWTMSVSDTNYNRIWTVDVIDNGALTNYHYNRYFNSGTVRPVVTLKKSAIK